MFWSDKKIQSVFVYFVVQESSHCTFDDFQIINVKFIKAYISDRTCIGFDNVIVLVLVLVDFCITSPRENLTDGAKSQSKSQDFFQK